MNQLKVAKENFKCRFCSMKSFSVINTYKHYWFSCNECNNVVRIVKEKYPFEFIPRSIWGKINDKLLQHPKSLRELIVYALYNNKVTNNDFYEYYLNFDNGFPKTSKGTKWEFEHKQVMSELNDWNISFENKTVLEISGGPGFFAQDLQHLAKKWIMTEYNDVVAKRMSDYFGIKTIKFDFNSDNLNEKIDEKVDFIFMRYCLNFCKDLNNLLQSFDEIMNKDGHVYVSFSPPTLGNSVRWSLDNYTFNVFYHPETVIRFFAENGFKLVGWKKEKPYHYLHSRVHKLHLYASPVLVPQYFLNRFKQINTDKNIKSYVMVFKKIK